MPLRTVINRGGSSGSFSADYARSSEWTSRQAGGAQIALICVSPDVPAEPTSLRGISWYGQRWCGQGVIACFAGVIGSHLRIVRADFPDGLSLFLAHSRLPRGAVTFRACPILRPVACIRAFWV
jgi:hypothetical protein